MSKLRVLNKNIESLYRDFFDGKFIVNRRYQRKLVWNLADKELLIDSIVNVFPLPSILLVENEDGSLDILDGMQRLNAIFSFIENKFKYEGNFFDVVVSSYAQKKSTQNNPSIGEDMSRKFLGYEISVLQVSGIKDEKEIDTIFKRLNSGGRLLSSQEIRQAGKTSKFAQKINEVSSYIRGDAIIDKKVPLDKMPLISLSIDESSKGGVNFEDTFFIKNGILNKKNILESEDEYLICHLIGFVLLDKKIEISTKSADWLYGIDNGYRTSSASKVEEIGNELESKIIYLESQGIDIKDNILYVYDLLKGFFDGSTYKFQNVFPDLKTNRSLKEFIIVYLSVYQIIYNNDHKKQKSIKKECDSAKLIRKLKLVSPNLDFAKGGTQAVVKIQANITKCMEILEPLFENETPSNNTSLIGNTEIESVINYSKIENSYYDFKIGICNFNTKKIEEGFFEKLGKTCIAISNSLTKSKEDKEKHGYLLIGIGDNLEQAMEIQKKFGFKYEIIAEKPIFGIENDILMLEITIDRYFSNFNSSLNTELSKFSIDINEAIKIDILNIKGKECIIVKIPSAINYGSPITINNTLYTRKGTSTLENKNVTDILSLGQKIQEYNR